MDLVEEDAERREHLRRGDAGAVVLAHRVLQVREERLVISPRDGVRVHLAGPDPEGLHTQFGHFENHVELVPRDGIEPPTHGFSVRCSTN